MAPEVAILIGLQGSGKSSFVVRKLKGYCHISKDHFPNARNRNKRQQRLLKEALFGDEPIVVDNTNPTRACREPIITMAKAVGARVIGYYLESSAKGCLERNEKRQGKERVPRVAIYATLAKLERPSYNEGFDELYYVSIKGDQFQIEKWQEEEE